MNAQRNFSSQLLAGLLVSAGCTSVQDLSSSQTSKDSHVHQPDAQMTWLTSYKDVEFEKLSYPQPSRQYIAELTYDASLERLKTAGFQRHARPQEVFRLIIDDLEGKLAGELRTVKDDMRLSFEWLSLAFEIRGDSLICYLDPSGLIWNGSKYEKKNFSYTREYIFDIKELPTRVLPDLGEFKSDFVKFFCGRSFCRLPIQLREGAKKVQVCLPPDGIIWPVGRESFGYGGDCSFNGYYHYNGASRGVRQRP